MNTASLKYADDDSSTRSGQVDTL